MRVASLALLALLTAGCAASSVPPPTRSTAAEASRRPADTAPHPSSTAQEPSPTTPWPSSSTPPRTTGTPTSPPVDENPSETPLDPRPDSFAYVVTDDLRVRSKPEVSTASERYEPLLWKGALVWVLEGPVRRSGYDWYRIIPMGEADLQYHPDPPPEGWVAAASKDGELWIADSGGSCETPLDTVSDFDFPPQGMLGLSCFGERSVEFDAKATRWDIECEAGGSELGLEPSWFRLCGDRYVVDLEGGFPQGERAPLYVILSPEAHVDIDRPRTTEAWVSVRVTGHYDDARARGCTKPSSHGLSEEEARERAVRTCRSRFVVTRIVS